MSVGRYETSLAICDQVAVEVGKGNVSALFASADPDIVLLRSLLNTCGRELAALRAWRQLLKAGSFTAPAAVAPAIYGVQALPADFNYSIDGTWRNATDNVALRAVDPAEWEHHIDNATACDPSIFRLDGNSVWLYAPSEGDSITYRYVSRYWVKPSGQTAPTASASTADTDTIYHDPLLIGRLLKLRWKAARGFDVSMEAADFRDAYNDAAGREQAHPVLTLGGGGRGFKWIDESNAPDTGFGL